jgi:nucleotide-binding universal stress UspA family protein
MPSVKRILFPVDFSERCAQTAPTVAAWAQKFQAKVTLLHAITLTQGIGDPGMYDALQPAIQRAAEDGLTAFAQKHFESLAVHTVVEAGGAGERIVARARKERASLIMMPTHGHGRFRRFLTGSVTAKVLHDAKTPVWTDAHIPKARRPGKMNVVLCAVDQTPEAIDLIQWAAWLAQKNDTALKVVHVMPAVDEKSQNRGERAVRQYWTTRASAGMAAILKKAGLPKASLILRGGDIATMLAATAHAERAGIVVIGRGRIHETWGRLRTNSLAIVCKSPCPVLSV